MIQWIKDYKPKSEREEKDRTHLLKMNPEFIGNTRDKSYHFTTASIVVNHEITKILFVYHKIYNSWGWPGGHVEGDEELFTSALRELYEETGLRYVVPVLDEPISMELQTVESHKRRGEFVDAHFHINFTFGFFGREDDMLKLNKEETKGVAWLDIDKLDYYVSEDYMLPIYKEMIHRIKLVKEQGSEALGPQ